MQAGGRDEEKEEPTFHFYFQIGITCLIVVFIGVFALSRSSIIDLPDIFLQVIGVILGAAITAYLTTTTYDYISTSTQRSQWRRENQMKMWEDVFRPIYEDVVSYSRSVMFYRYARTEIWDKSEFQTKITVLEIVNETYFDCVKRHVYLFDHYNEAYIAFERAVDGLLESYLTSLFPGKDVRELVRILHTEMLYLAGRQPSMDEGARRSFGSLHTAFREELPGGGEDAGTTIDILASRVKNLRETKEFLSTHSKLSDSIEELLAFTKDVVKEPYRV